MTHCFQFVYMYYFCRLLIYHSYGLVFPTSLVECKKIVCVMSGEESQGPALWLGDEVTINRSCSVMGQNGACSVHLLCISYHRLSLWTTVMEGKGEMAGTPGRLSACCNVKEKSVSDSNKETRRQKGPWSLWLRNTKHNIPFFDLS